MTNSPPDQPHPPQTPEPFEPPRADDLPHVGDGQGGPPPGVFDRSGSVEADPQGWVPARATSPTPSPTAASPAHPGATTLTPGEVVGRRVKPWQFLLGLALVFVPLLVWLAVSLGKGTKAPDPVSLPATTAPSSPATPFAPPVFTPPPRVTPSLAPTYRPSATVRTGPTATRRGSKPTNPSPPAALPAPGLKITAIPTDAKTIRFELVAEKGLPLEVSFRDRTYDTVNYPARKGALAIEVPVGDLTKNRDVSYSVSARIPYDSRSDRGANVLCRVLVDGVLVSSQQRQGYSSCYLSPAYDIAGR